MTEKLKLGAAIRVVPLRTGVFEEPVAREAVHMQIAGSDYSLDYQGRIISPGKFEGEPAFVPYLWDCALLGGDYDGDLIELEITPEDVEAWPDLAGKHRAFLREDGNGFVHCELE